jgi:ABC-type Co2+ transport system permease subunit
MGVPKKSSDIFGGLRFLCRVGSVALSLASFVAPAVWLANYATRHPDISEQKAWGVLAVAGAGLVVLQACKIPLAMLHNKLDRA